MQFILTFDNSISEFLSNLVSLCNTHRRQSVRDKVFSLFQLLVEMDLNFYHLLSVFSALDDITADEVQLIIQLSPLPDIVEPVSYKNVRMAIPRWTASKYHSGQIEVVIQHIISLIQNNERGLYVYNSNLNPKNKRSFNDLYLLLIDEDTVRWYDINRQVTIQFIQNEG